MEPYIQLKVIPADPTLYSTWQQLPTAKKPVAYLMCTHITIEKGERKSLTILNLDGLLNATEMKPEKFESLLQQKLIQPWVPGAGYDAKQYPAGTR